MSGATFPTKSSLRSSAALQESLPISTVVLYGDNNNWFAAFAFWQFKIYGHKDVQLMNGGRKKWELEGRPLTTEVTPITPTEYRPA